MVTSDVSNIPAIRLTRFFMRFTGFWISDDPRGKLLMDLMTGYTIVAIAFAWYLVTSDLWFCRSNFQEATYAATNVMTVLTILIKLTMFSLRREEFMHLIRTCYDKFWRVDYDVDDLSILRNCELRCVYFVRTFTFFALTTVCTYTAYPIIKNVGKNETERIHPFTLWINLPITTTPYFEMIFVGEVLACFHSGVCYFCFDNLLCIMNVFTAGQFRMLQRKFQLVKCTDGFDSRIKSLMEIALDNESRDTPRNGTPEKLYKCNETLEDCIKQHQSLIRFIESVESMYTLVILGQVVVFSLLICLVSYQAILAEGEFSRRMIFIVHSAGTFTQLFMFTLTCDDLTSESKGVAEAAYAARWYCCLSDPSRKTLGKDLQFVIMRARRSCCLTAGGFFPISLETFTTILSTAMSYLTLLRNGQAND